MTFGEAGVPRLHVVTDDAVLARDGWASVAASVLEAGGRAVSLHVRGPRTSGAEIFRLVAEILPEARRAGAFLGVNDRVDIAIATGVSFVHLGRRSLPLEEVRRLVGDQMCIGVSCHEEDQVNSARSGGADYAFVGMTFPTRSHPEAVAIGIDGVRRMAACAAGLPAIAIGGMGPEQAAEVVRCGAYGVAAIRGVWNAANPADAVMAYLAALEDC